jgi:mannosyltransferase OCH1-like enzyme
MEKIFMIPKQLFFIWFGDNKPNYVDFAVNAFKKVNSDFNIELIYEKDPFSSSNEDIKYCCDIVDHKIHIEKYDNRLKSEWFVQQYKNNKRQRLCDIFREYLINKYGGIYLDCDTFPVKPFDDDLLNHSSFIATSYVRSINRIITDNYFFGQVKGNDEIGMYDNMEGIVNGKYHLPCENIINNKDKKFLHLKNKFFKLELKYGESFSNGYIDHYNFKDWKK